ncbi:hypothetical protein ACW5EG_05795 [Luteimonas sp. A611]
MNDRRHDHDLPAALRMQLRALRTPEPPARELWPDIAARIAAQPQVPEASPRRHPRLFPALAAAAVLALAIGLGWQLQPSGAEPAQASAVANALPAASPAPLVIMADAMTREYRGALREVPAPRPATAGYDSLIELDASAAAVREALAQDPDAFFLLQRLQHIHARRLALTRQLASA